METQAVFELAVKLAAVQDWVADQLPFPGVVDRSIRGLRLSIDPNGVTPSPSSNRNRAHCVPSAGNWSPRHAEACIGRFRDAGVARFFFWLSPGPLADEVERDLIAHGFARFGGTDYPILVRAAQPVTPPATSLAIRRLDPAADCDVVAAFGDRQAIALFGCNGIEHFMAFDGETPAALAALAVQDGVCYLFNASTRESHRGRGGQSALIAARVARAAELGCQWAMSETLGLLKTSLNNLQRRGFQHAFSKIVFEWPAR